MTQQGGTEANLKTLREMMAGDGVDAVWLTDPCHFMYYTGYRGDTGAVFASRDELILMTDSRYVTQAREEAPQAEILEVTKGRTYGDVLESLVKKTDARRIGFCSDTTPQKDYALYREKASEAVWIPYEQELAFPRRIKTQEEVRKIRQAEDIGSEVYEEAVRLIAPGMTELELAAEIEYRMKKKGALRTSFDTIAVSGSRTAMPHGQPSLKKIVPGDMITMDYGCIFDGYCSDMTRSLVLGEGSAKEREIYGIVLNAQKMAEAAVRPGVRCSEIDRIARDYIAEKGYGAYFGHGLGHSLGILIHEDPRFAPGCEDLLEPGMILSVEPGIYLPGEFGVRIEDIVLVTENGCVNLTKAPKDYCEITV